jgi:hypothetical protein
MRLSSRNLWPPRHKPSPAARVFRSPGLPGMRASSNAPDIESRALEPFRRVQLLSAVPRPTPETSPVEFARGIPSPVSRRSRSESPCLTAEFETSNTEPASGGDAGHSHRKPVPIASCLTASVRDSRTRLRSASVQHTAASLAVVSLITDQIQSGESYDWGTHEVD